MPDVGGLNIELLSLQTGFDQHTRAAVFRLDGQPVEARVSSILVSAQSFVDYVAPDREV